jgi:hypothetical protein
LGGEVVGRLPYAIYLSRLMKSSGFAFNGPGRSTIPLGSKVMQQPRSIQGLPGSVMPNTITFTVRIVPSGALPIHG